MTDHEPKYWNYFLLNKEKDFWSFTFPLFFLIRIVLWTQEKFTGEIPLVKTRCRLVVKWLCCFKLLGAMYWKESVTICFLFHSILRLTLDNYIIISWDQELPAHLCNINSSVTYLLNSRGPQSEFNVIHKPIEIACNILWMGIHLLFLENT